MKRSLKVVSALLATGLAGLAALGAGRPGPPALMVLSVSGLRPGDVIDADRHGLRIPNLRRMLRQGLHATAVTSAAPAGTDASHTTLVTGVPPARHGIAHGRQFDPIGGNAGNRHWSSADIRVETLWEAASRVGLATSAVHWPVTVGANIPFNIAPSWHALVAGLSDGMKVLAEAEQATDSYPRGHSGIAEDERRSALGVYLLEEKKPPLHFIRFSSLSEARRASGPDGLAGFEALEQIDRLVGRLREAADRATDGRFVMAVVSDQGFTQTTREVDLNQALHRESLLQLDSAGHVRGWRAVAWGEGGSAGIVLRDPHDEAARVRGVLHRLAGMPKSPIDRFIETPASRANGGSPSEAFTVFLSLDTRLVDSGRGEVLRAALPAGEQGHDPQRPEMDAAFFMAGSGVPAGGTLGRIDIRDVAPTLARVLGLDLVTLTDHDSIEGALSLSHLAGTFVSEEVTLLLPAGRQLHLGVYDIDEAQHVRIGALRRDPEGLFAYLAEKRIPACLNHPFSALTGRRELVDLQLPLGRLPLIEALNGSMPAAHNESARLLGRASGMAPLGGSDSHTLAGVARAFTTVAGARTKEEFIEGLRCGFSVPSGCSGSYARLTCEVTRIFAAAYGDAAEAAARGAAPLRLIALLGLAPLLPLIPVFTAAAYFRELRFGARWFGRFRTDHRTQLTTIRPTGLVAGAGVRPRA